MEKLKIFTKKSPAAIGPYSQAIRIDRFLFVSGQLPIHPETGELLEGGIEEKTARVIENLRAILEQAGGSLESVVKTTIFMKNMADFSAVNQVYARYFGSSLPARSTVQVAALPRDAEIEMEAIAWIG